MIQKIDHLVITTAQPEKLLPFYEALGFTAKEDGGRYALFAGNFKINVHIKGRELSPHAAHIVPGSADLCFEVTGPLANFKETLLAKGLTVELGIVDRNGVRGKMQSIYLRDPDCNLIEFCCYAPQA